MKAVVETIELPMAGQESEPAIFLGEANVGLGRITASSQIASRDSLKCKARQ